MKFTIQGELCNYNKYDNAARSHWSKGAKIKKEETQRVYYEILSQKVKPMKKITEMICTWYTKDLKVDSDGISFAIKFLYDGMVLAKVIPNDSRRYTGSIYHLFEIDKKNPRCEVELI